MSIFSFQRQKTMFSFYLVCSLFLLLIRLHSCQIVLSAFRCGGGLNEMSESSGCPLGDILNLTGQGSGQDLSEDLSNTLSISTEMTNIQNASTIEESEKNVSFVKVTKPVSDILSLNVFEEKNGFTKPLQELFKEEELIKNSDFEENLKGWNCYRCSLHRVPGGYQSRYAAKIINKGHKHSSLRASIKVDPGRYYFTAYVKLLKSKIHNVVYTTVDVIAKIRQGTKHIYMKLGGTSRVQPDTRWYKVGGDVFVPKGSTVMEVYVHVWTPHLSHLFDRATCTRIDPIPNWRNQTEKRIEQIRKANIVVRLNVTEKLKGYTLKIIPTKAKFKWGGAVKTWLINNPRQKKFHNFMYKNFNWAVIENALKWANDEPAKGKNNLSAAKKTVDLLLKNNLHVRGHTLFYGISDPHWVKHLKGKELLKTLETRINDVMTPFKNKISMWDVSNENLRSSIYEKLSSDPNITQKMFVMANKKDPNTRLFFNENMVVNYGFNTVALEDRAKMYLETGLPLHGIGIQSHMRGSIDVFIVMRRLDEVAKAGLPILITELTYENEALGQRLLSYDKLLRIYFSHPAVEGILFWTVWSNHWRQTAALLDRHFNVNEVGKLFLSLKSEWTTPPIEYDLSDSVKNFSVFLGEYRILLSKSDGTIWKRTLKIEDAGSTTTLVIGDTQEVGSGQ